VTVDSEQCHFELSHRPTKGGRAWIGRRREETKSFGVFLGNKCVDSRREALCRAYSLAREGEVGSASRSIKRREV